MHKKYLNLCDNFWLSEYVKFLSGKAEILIFDQKNLNKIEIESFLKMWGEHEFIFVDNDLNNHVNLVGQFYIHLNKINNKYQDLIKDFIYTDLKTPKKNQKLSTISTFPTWIFLGGKDERADFENILRDYYLQNLDQDSISELDKKEQFFLNPLKLLKHSDRLPNFPKIDEFFSKRSKTIALSLSQKIPYFKKDFSIVQDLNSFIFWNIQVGMFFEISGSIKNTEDGFMQKITFKRLTIF
ncbi:MAG: hypothetical protein ACRCXZ_04850 [Patescibacteria group bacterium]